MTLPTIETAALTQRSVMPATVAMFFLAGLLTFIVAGMIAGFTGHSDVPGGLLVGIAVAGGLVGAGGSYWTSYRIDQRILADTTLTVSPDGLVHSDGACIIAMRWSAIRRIGVHNRSMKPELVEGLPWQLGVPLNAARIAARNTPMLALVGEVTMSPIPGGYRRLQRLHDRNLRGLGARLSEGVPLLIDDGVVFPGCFEEHWQTGVIGSWLAYCRPDLNSAGPYA